MPESTKQAKAQVAKVEDYDSDESNVIAGTARLASQVGVKQSSSSSSSKRPQQPKVSHRDAHSDSGYNSKATKNPVSVTTASSSRTTVVQQPTATTTPIKLASSSHAAPRSKSSKPVIHRNDSGRTSAQPVRPAQVTTKHTSCTDPYCRDPDCDKFRKQERRKTIVSQPPSQNQQYPVLHQYSQPTQYTYAAPYDTNSMLPPTRPHAGSTSRPRPVSMYGYGIPSIPMPSSPQQPQPFTHYAGYAQPQMYASQPPPANMGVVYQPASPVQVSPTSPTYPAYPPQSSNPGTYSARQVNPSIPGLGPPKLAPLAGGGQYVSARRNEDQHYRERPEQYSSESESASEYNYTTEEERPIQRKHSRRRRPSEKAVAVIPHPTRPSVKKYYTEQQTLPTRSRHDTRQRQPLSRAGRSDGDVYYSDEVGDSDRTARAVVARPSYAASSSRRPSIATTSSSGRTKATTLSSNTDYSSHGRIVVEGKHDRKATYLSKERQSELRAQQKLRDAEEERRRLRESVDAYQKGMQGNVEPYELTAENMRKKDDGRRRSASYISNSRSHRSSASQGAGGIKIQSGGTVLHVFGDAKVEMRAGGDGEPATFVVAGGGGDGGGSRSSRSGKVRSDVRQRAIREENSFDDGYEVAR